MTFPKSSKYLAAGLLVLFVALAGVLIFKGKPAPITPLPFDDKVFISVAPHPSLFTPPANAGVLTRMKIALFDFSQKLRGTNASTWSFPASPKTGCSVQGLLYECADVTGMRYLMPSGVAAGTVQFGNTNALNGPQWVAAFEKELQTGDTQYFDSQSRRPRPEHFVLLRFPAQKTIVVLPESEAADFLRTNGIHLPESKGGK